jgi:hypothetical protein
MSNAEEEKVMFSEYFNLSEIMVVVGIGFLLIFIGYAFRGIWGAITLLALGTLFYVYKRGIPLS